MLALPLSWPLDGKRVALIGSGPWLARKLTLLSRTTASLCVFAPDGDAEGEHRWPEAAELDGMALIFVAFEDRALAERGAALARQTGAPLNVVDYPDLSDFHVPAIIDRGALSIGIATGGVAPVLARDTRRKVEAAVPPSDAHLAEFALKLSPHLRTRFTNVDDRRRVWEHLLDSAAARTAREGKVDEALTEALNSLDNSAPRQGVVHLVGAGPGDPELLTLKALRLLSEADVIVYDRLVGQGIMDLARRDSERLYVGKARSNHSVPQDQIHDLLVEQAQQGKRVVRLKGGDPFVFGRGGEEVQALREAGIEVHVVPGITAALGCAASTLVPLTHRDYAQSVTFITGHAKNGDTANPLTLDWTALSATHHTLVVYMGVATAQSTAANLLRHGRAADTPVLIVENGTRPDERRTLTTLAKLNWTLETDAPRGPGSAPPTLLIIGEVAGLYDPASLIRTAVTTEFNT